MTPPCGQWLIQQQQQQNPVLGVLSKSFCLFSSFWGRNLAPCTCFNRISSVVIWPSVQSGAVLNTEPGDMCAWRRVCARISDCAELKGSISGLSVADYEGAYLKRSPSPLTPSFALNSWVTATAEPPWSACWKTTNQILSRHGSQFIRDCFSLFFNFHSTNTGTALGHVGQVQLKAFTSLSWWRSLTSSSL